MPATEVTWALLVPGDVILAADGKREFEIAERLSETRLRLVSLETEKPFELDTAKADTPRVLRVATAQERRELATALAQVRLRGEVLAEQPGPGEAYHWPVFDHTSDVGTLLTHLYLAHERHDPKAPTSWPEGTLVDRLRAHDALHAANDMAERHVHTPGFGVDTENPEP